MYKVTILFTALLLGACTSSNHDEPQEPLSRGNQLPATSAINHMSEQIVSELVEQNDELSSKQPLLVATPVLLDSFNKTNAVGLQLQQGFISALHARQFNLVDINVGDNIRVTPDGDFLLTRDWKQLPSGIAVEHVVVSTMSMNRKGAVVNTRIVNITNNRVVSASQGAFSINELPGYLSQSEKVVSKDGLLYRDTQRGSQEVQVIGGVQ
ncbi:FlgO family outer membrane protein [Shewanella sp. UCD-KL12]|uniref:FlgO family outer membrane protein n=1 Tax=Shewanella sp. UCD-KL12 TaxID=1917163 RepID=UPI00097137DC|nr:FlgO family outer membrane protein [Shewanella sp. UCD-KL12]